MKLKPKQQGKTGAAAPRVPAPRARTRSASSRKGFFTSRSASRSGGRAANRPGSRAAGRAADRAAEKRATPGRGTGLRLRRNRRPRLRHLISDLSVKIKVFMLLLLGVIAVGAVAMVGQQGIETVRGSGTTTIEQVAVPALNLGAARENFARERFRLFQAASLQKQDDISDALALMAQNQKAVDDSIAALQKMKLTPDQKDILNSDLIGAVGMMHSMINVQISSMVDHPMTAQERTRFSKFWSKKAQPQADRAEGAFNDLDKAFKKAMTRSTKDMKDTRDTSTTLLWSIGGVTALLVFLGGAWISRLITRPLRKVQDVLLSVAEGDLTREVKVDSRDEIGEMAQALAVAQESLRNAIQTVTGTSTALAGNAEQLSAVSAQVADSAEQTTIQASSAASAAEEVSRNVQTVAVATEEMTGSIREISVSSTDAARVAAAAVTEAEAASGTIAKLGDSSAEIGDVVKVITSIAEQTNLLALNATIEAARAGDAGKGFAVVASEVKDLAQETSRATEDISQRVEAIQADAQAAVTAVAKISEIIEEINTYQTAIAGAVEEQSATTSEMARNVSDAADGASAIARNIEFVAGAAERSSTGILEAQRAANDLAQLSRELRELTTRFRL